jgi:hypothetical protein
MTNKTTIVKDFSYLGETFNSYPTELKKSIVADEINQSRYTILGAVNQYGKFTLKCRFHNKRNKKGMWIR